MGNDHDDMDYFTFMKTLIYISLEYSINFRLVLMGHFESQLLGCNWDKTPQPLNTHNLLSKYLETSLFGFGVSLLNKRMNLKTPLKEQWLSQLFGIAVLQELELDRVCWQAVNRGLFHKSGNLGYFHLIIIPDFSNLLACISWFIVNHYPELLESLLRKTKKCDYPWIKPD